MRGFYFLFSFLLLITELPLLKAGDWNPLSGPWQVWVGPEAYHVRRCRTVGSEQCGWLYGVHGGIDRLQGNAIYYGFEGYYACGCIEGKTGMGTRVESRMSDADAEGKIGYTFAIPLCGCLSLTPFTGGGYFWNVNQFRKPEKMRFRFRDTFGFWTLGGSIQWSFASRWSIGLIGKARIMFHGRSFVSRDPINKDRTLIMGNRPHYEVELPLSTYFCLCEQNWGVSLVPFYRYRHYGGRENFPFDFFDTRIQIWGLRTQLDYLF